LDRPLDRSFVDRRLRRRWAWAGIGLAALLLVGFALPRLFRPALHVGPGQTARVERGPVEAVLQATGTVVPAFEQTLSSPADARVLRILRQPGDALLAGDSIVELDLSASRLDLERADEQLSAKRSLLEQALLEQEGRLADLSGGREAKRLDAEFHEYRLRQQRELHEQGLTSESVLRQVELEHQKVAIELVQLDGSMDRARRTGAERAAAMLREIAVLEKTRDAAALRLELAQARADRPGVLTWVVPEVGTTVRAGEALARIADLGSFRVEASVADTLASQLAVGMGARVGVDRAMLEARVAAIQPTVERGATRFDVVLGQPSHAALRPQRTVDVYVVTRVLPDALRVRRGPFARAGRRQPVFVVRGDRAIRVESEIGLAGIEYFEIVAGPQQGDEVVTADVTGYEHLRSFRIRRNASTQER